MTRCKKGPLDQASINTLQRYYYESPNGQAMLARCMDRVPMSEVKFLFDVTHETDYSGDRIMQAKAGVASNRLINRICNKCRNKDDFWGLFACDKCEMTWYCSKACQAADADRHSKWCCQPDSPPDLGPMGSSVVKLPERRIVTVNDVYGPYV